MSPSKASSTKAAPKKKVATKKKAATTKKKVTTKKKASTTTKAAAASKKKSTVSQEAKTSSAPKKMSAAEAKARADKLLQGFGNFEPYQIKEGEEYMNEDQIAHFRNILLAWKHALMEEVDRTVQHMKDEAANFPDPNDRASQESDFTMELRTRDRERKLIKKIESTINIIDNDEEYGYCESCGVEIGIRRLEARPTANLCIDCKTLDEIRERQKGG